MRYGIVVVVDASVLTFALLDVATAEQCSDPSGATLERNQAEQGIIAAQAQLGYMYAIGCGVRQDYPEAVAWYRKAAEQGNAVGQSRLGTMYEQGHGVPQDYVQAHLWLNLAASADETQREISRVNIAKSRDRIAAKMTSDQIAEAQRLAREWKPE